MEMRPAMTTTDLRDRIADGAMRAAEAAEGWLSAIARREPELGAWAFVDGEHALRQARALDAYRDTGRSLGALHGMAVGVADVIDTAGMRTGNGCAVDAGRVPAADAFVVARLKQAGAVVMGKTAVSELGLPGPGRTRNPHHPAHSAGGGGAAAAVAAGMVPLAIGVQGAGAVIRTAAHCGVVGFKPSFGAIPRSGILLGSPSLDTVGVFAADVEGVALLAEPLFGCDAGDPATLPLPAPRLPEVAASAPPVRPAFAFVRPPGWDAADADTRDAFAELASALGDACDEVVLPAPFAEATRWHEVIRRAEAAKALHAYDARGGAALGEAVRAALADGRRILAQDYLAARDWPGILAAGLEEVFARFDAIVTPATPGPAPRGTGPGSSAFTVTWSLCGLPAVTLPLLRGRDGLPMGVQLVGRRGQDARLLRTARWLARHLSSLD